MKILRYCLLASAVATISFSAVAQWQWKDAHGQRVYSDRAPPSDIAEKDILKRPGSSAKKDLQADKGALATASAAKGAASTPKLSSTDKGLIEKKRKADEDQAAKRKAADEKVQQAKNDNCARARQAKTTYDSGIRVARINAQGEREVMDDSARSAEINRIQAIISSDCQ